MKALKQNLYIKVAFFVSVMVVGTWYSGPAWSDSNSQEKTVTTISETAGQSQDDDSSMVPKYGRGGGVSRASSPRVAPRPVSRPSYSPPRVSRPVSQPRYTAPRVSRPTTPSRTSVRTQPTRTTSIVRTQPIRTTPPIQRENTADSDNSACHHCADTTGSSNYADLERAASQHSLNTHWLGTCPPTPFIGYFNRRSETRN